jgi:hypothetical protein
MACAKAVREWQAKNKSDEFQSRRFQGNVPVARMNRMTDVNQLCEEAVAEIEVDFEYGAGSQARPC